MCEESAIRDDIQTRLDAVERDEEVRVVFACESGSRAWGFASRDSDYDVRFLYVHPRDWYLSIDLERRRDVIERPITDEIDLSGWDVRKALQLRRASNVTPFEWLRSPTVYRAEHEVVARLRALADMCYSPRSAFYHYSSMARSIAGRSLKGDTVRLKRYFYMLRPVLVCRWIAAGRGIPPMEFDALVEAELHDRALRAAVDDLLARKRRGDELDSAPRIGVIDEFLVGELERFEDLAPELEAVKPEMEPLNRTFREIVARS